MEAEIERYISYRKNLGYSSKNLMPALKHLDRYLVKQHAGWHQLLQPCFFLQMREHLPGETRSVNGIITTVRGFFNFLVRRETIAENPLKDIPAYRQNAYIPFVFSIEQTQLLLVAVQNAIRRQEQFFLHDQAVWLAIELMAGCGLRIAEPLHLLVKQYHPHEKTIYIEKTKFKKDRLLPLPDSLNSAVQNYLSLRNAFLPPADTACLLTGMNQKGLSTKNIYPVFHQAVKAIGLDQKKRIIANTTFAAPTPHSLRHSFAVNSLKGIMERGGSGQNALPILSIYMGHCKYRYTALYLKVIDAQQRSGLVDFNIAHQEEL